MSDINVKFSKGLFNPVYIPTYKCKDRLLLLYGGAGSGKSEWAAQKILRRMLKEKGHRFLFTRKVGVTIRDSQFALFKDLTRRWKLQHLFEFTDLRVRCVNGNEIICRGMDSTEKMKSITSITGIWAEELTEFTKEDVLQLNLRMRGSSQNYKQFIGTFNPTDIEHWIRKEHFPEGDTANDYFRFRLNGEFDEFGELYGTALRTTFRSNKFLTNSDRAIMAATQQQDENYHKIYTLGLWGTKAKGLLYKKYKIVEEMPDNLQYEFYGLDFGFTNPTALVHIGIKDAEVYIHQLIYQSSMTNPELILQLKELVPNRNVEIFADSAAPDKIEEIFNAGFNIQPANKDVKHGIGIVQSIMLNITAASTSVIYEIGKYRTKADKNGDPTDEVLKICDHAMDAIRYGIYTAWLRYGQQIFTGIRIQSTTTKPKREKREREPKFSNY